MPSVATWWCGQPRELDYVTRASRRAGAEADVPAARRRCRVRRASSVSREKAAFLARLAAEPAQFVAQERVALSTAPSAAGER